MNKIDYKVKMSVKELTGEVNKRLTVIREMLLNDDDRKMVDQNFKAISQAFKNMDKQLNKKMDKGFDRLNKKMDTLYRDLLKAIKSSKKD